MVVYIEDTVDSTKNLFDLISEFGKKKVNLYPAGYKVNTQTKGILVQQQ